MALVAALVAATLVLVDPPTDELGGSAVVGGDGDGEGAAVEDLAVHSPDGGGGIVAGDEEDEGDAAAPAGDPVLEDGDAGDLPEGGEDGVEIGVGERVVEVGDVDRRFGGGEAAGSALGGGAGGGPVVVAAAGNNGGG